MKILEKEKYYNNQKQRISALFQELSHTLVANKSVYYFVIRQIVQMSRYIQLPQH